MSKFKHNVQISSPSEITTIQRYSSQDLNLIDTFNISRQFDRSKHIVELHIYTLGNNLLFSDYNYSHYSQLLEGSGVGDSGSINLTVFPLKDIERYGFNNGNVKLFYNFLNNLYSENKQDVKFYIQEISPDRTELKLQNTTPTLTANEITNYTNRIKENLTGNSFFSEFRLNFNKNNLLIGVNIDIDQTKPNQVSVLVKLYQPLPQEFTLKNEVSIVEIISDSTVFNVISEFEVEQVKLPSLRPANFNLEDTTFSTLPTQYFNFDELFSYTVTGSNYEIYSLFNEKGFQLSVDHTNYENFIHFSSAEERLRNFRYKLDLLNSYENSLYLINSSSINSIGISGSRQYFENLITGVINNFDHYERFLYYESSSYTWPKLNITKPYINAASSQSIAVTWYGNQLLSASNFDTQNFNALENTIPAYLREDPANSPYVTFIHMIGQHFDNLWLYTKSITNRHSGDNRLNFGVTKDLIEDVLTNFGIKLHTGIKSNEDLFSYYSINTYNSGSEQINTYVTSSQPEVSYYDYQKEIYKRIYHNLPFLIKTKGTERGIRALINCFGIPPDILLIKTYGGRNSNERPFFAYEQPHTGSLSKIRLDNTGSQISGSTLSTFTYTQQLEEKYIQDLHRVEVGFSSTDSIDNYILSEISSSFNIDEYIGDPRNLNKGSYEGLYQVAQSILQTMNRYDLKDFIRFIKFFDNTLFKLIRDFTPGRTVTDTGIIIKPHLLNRSKYKSVSTSVSQPEYTSSVDTAFITGSHGGIYDLPSTYLTSYTESLQTPFGTKQKPEVSSYISFQGDVKHLTLLARTDGETPKYTGELSGSKMVITTGELNSANPFKNLQYTNLFYDVVLRGSLGGVCLLRTSSNPVNQYITSQQPYDLKSFFVFGNNIANYTITGSTIQTSQTASYIFESSSYSQGDILQIAAQNSGSSDCNATASVIFAYCNLRNLTSSHTIPINTTRNISSWFSVGFPNNQTSSINYTIIKQDLTQINITGSQSSSYYFSDGVYTTENVTVRVTDASLNGQPNECSTQIIIGINASCPLGRNEFAFSLVTFEGSNISVPNYFTGENPMITQYFYQLDGGPVTAIPSNQTSSFNIPTGDCLILSASNGGTCVAVGGIGIRRLGERLTIQIGVKEDATDSLRVTYNNCSGNPEQVNISNGSLGIVIENGTLPIFTVVDSLNNPVARSIDYTTISLGANSGYCPTEC